MTQPIWHKLMRLVEVDKKIEESRQKTEDIKKQIESHNIHKQSLQKLVEGLEREVILQKRSIKNIDDKISHAREIEIDKKKALDLVHTQKEYNALKKELDTASSTIQSLEDQLLAEWHNLESLEKKLSQEKAVYSDNVEKIEKESIELEQNIAMLEENIRAQMETQEKMITDLPKEWQDKYKQMKGKVTNPIVPILDDHCSECYYQVLASDLARIKKNAVLPCRGCFRFLYYDKEAEEIAHKASY